MSKRCCCLMVSLVLFGFSLQGVDFDEVERFLDKQGLGVCVYRPGADRLSFQEVCGEALATWGVGSNQLFSVLRDYAVDRVRTNGFATNRLEVVRVRRALNMLKDYDGVNSAETFLQCATNCGNASVAYSAFRQYALSGGIDAAIGVLAQESGVGSPETAVFVQGGASSAFDDIGGTSTQTNKMISLEMRHILFCRRRWSESDGYVCRWWPDYATSSNRYVAAQRALQAIPPPASSNYLNRVIAELEALPPGTMRMLSTNHLGQAWQE